MSEETTDFKALREALDAGPTGGRWRWEINMENKRLHLVGGPYREFDLTIMDFDRWGMSHAVATLRDPSVDGMNVMHRLPDRKDWFAPFPGREHHANWCQQVTHPDMRWIQEASPRVIRSLLAERDRLAAEVDALCIVAHNTVNLLDHLMSEGLSRQKYALASRVCEQAKEAFGGAATKGEPSPGRQMVSVCKEDAEAYCRILSVLGMEEEGDPVAVVEALRADAGHVAAVMQSTLGATRNQSGLNSDEKALWDQCQRVMEATEMSDSSSPADPMDWPLPCDVTVGHGTICKGVKLRTLVARMKVLYEMATGANADEVAARTPEECAVLAAKFLAQKDAP